MHAEDAGSLTRTFEQFHPFYEIELLPWKFEKIEFCQICFVELEELPFRVYTPPDIGGKNVQRQAFRLSVAWAGL